MYHGERQAFAETMQEQTKKSDDSSKDEISKKLRDIVETSRLSELSKVMTEEEVINEEKRKIQKVLRDQFPEGIEGDMDSDEIDVYSKMDKIIDIITSNTISHTYEKNNGHTNEIDRTKVEEESREYKNADKKHLGNKESDEL